MLFNSLIIGLLLLYNNGSHKQLGFSHQHIAPITFQDSTYYKDFMYISEVNPKSLFYEIPSIKHILTQSIEYFTSNMPNECQKLTKLSLTITKSQLSNSYMIYVSGHADVRIDSIGYCPAVSGNIQFFNYSGIIVFLHQFRGIEQQSIFGASEKYIPDNLFNLKILKTMLKIELLTPIIYSDYEYLYWIVKDDKLSKMEIII